MSQKLKIEDRPFKTPVIIEPGRLGRLREVRSVWEAMHVLHGRWPEVHGKRYHAALTALEQALLGEISVHAARRSFVAAAEESRVLVQAGVYPSVSGKKSDARKEP